ncbi:MAG: hypothetical protein ACRETC_06955 [Gammaproteobacteria bacterium]
MPFEGLADRAMHSLEALKNSVDGTAPAQTECWDFDVPRFAEGAAGPEIVLAVDAWANVHYYLYYFELLGNANVEHIVEEFALAKAQGRDGRSYSRLNELSQILYVGGSRSIATRLRQHLGFGARKTYSLHLSHWAQDLGLNLRFYCAGFEDAQDAEVFQTLEDQLWEESTPMFGRKGRR